MRTDSVKSGSLTETGGKLVVTSFAVAFVAMLVAMPRAVPPTELPPLVLDGAAADAAAREDAELATHAPTGPAVSRFLEAYDEQGRAELADPPQPAPVRDARLGRMRRDLGEIAAAFGDDAIPALRAAAVARVEPLARGEQSLDEAVEAVGSFVEVVRGYGLHRQGRPFAPPIVYRALYKARWNALAALPFTEGLHPIEVQAYWGWLAFHADGAEMGRRAEAFRQFVQAGGEASDEAIGTMAYFVEDFPGAARYFDRARASTGSLRLRNHALAARAMQGP